MVVLIEALERVGVSDVRLIVFGEPVLRAELEKIDTTWIPLEADFAHELRNELNRHPCRVVVFDLHPGSVPADMNTLLEDFSRRGIPLVGVDSLCDQSMLLDLTWIPAFFLPEDILMRCSHANCVYGWHSFLLRKRLPTSPWLPGARILVLTGGGDVRGLGQSLPSQIDARLPSGSQIHWVRGPFAATPVVPDFPRLIWIIHDAPDGLDDLIVNANFVLTVFGVSFFEALQYGIPTVVFSPYDKKDERELNALQGESVAMVAGDAEDAVMKLDHLMGNVELAKELSQAAAAKFSVNGSDRLASRIKTWCCP